MNDHASSHLSSPLKVSIDATALANPRRTGIGRTLESILPELVATAQGARIRLFAGGKSLGPVASELLHEGRIESETVIFPSLYLWQQTGMASAIRRYGPHVHLAPEGLLPLGLNCPALGIVHDILWRRYPESCKSHVRWTYQCRFASSLRKLAAVHYDSQFTRTEIDTLMRGLSPQDASVVPLGVDHSKFLPFSEGMTSELDSLLRRHHVQQPYILTVGNIRTHKNLDVVLRAHRSLRTDSSECPDLVVVGSGEFPLDEGDRQSVRPLGYVDEADLPLLYRGASLFIFPSRYEGFGLPLLEAMASGVPVLYAEGGALPEVAGDAGIAFDPDDDGKLACQMAGVLEDSELQIKLREASIERAAAFRWESTARSVWDSLKRIAAAEIPDSDRQNCA